MTVKAKMKRTVERAVGAVPAKNGNGRPQTTPPRDYKLIPWKDLQISPTNPRRRIDEKKIGSLAASVRLKGILEPLIVRRSGKKFEIVCGERRYRAASIAEVREVPCLIEDLSDEEVLDTQIHENLHRDDLHPMDEAFAYQFLQGKLGCGVKELALRVGKPEGYVVNHLKLNLLIEEAQKDIDDGNLPLTYALEMAKYPREIQKIIYEVVYRTAGEYREDTYVQVPVKGEMVPFKSLLEWINTNIHHLLAAAPFNPKATDLRSDGLACVKCPDRTGAAASLFEPNQIGRKDSCLNPSCYRQKSETHLQLRIQELAKLSGIEPSEVPIVKSTRYSDGEGYLGGQSAAIVGGTKEGDKKPCKKAVRALDIDSDNYGRTVEVCLRSSGCETHWKDSAAPKTGGAEEKSGAEQAAERLEAHRTRREEIWNAKVAEAVRVRVFKQAAEAFEKTFSIAGSSLEFLPELIARFWRMTASGDSNNLNAVVKYLLSEWTGNLEGNQGGTYHLDSGTAIETVRKLERNLQFRVLFLLVHCHKGTIGQTHNYTPQKEVRDLASEFEVDYAVIDADVRLEFSAKKHKDAHQTYLAAVRAKTKDAKAPRLFSERWKAEE